MKSLLIISAMMLLRLVPAAANAGDPQTPVTLQTTLPDQVVVVNLSRLKQETRAISMLQPVWLIAEKASLASQKLFGKKLKLTVTKTDLSATYRSPIETKNL